MPTGTCYIHTRSAATLRCGHCRRDICDRCVQSSSGALICPACVGDVQAAQRRNRALRMAALLVVLVGAATAAVWAVMQPPRGPAGPPVTVAEAQEATEDHPDDPIAWTRLGELHLQKEAFADAEAAFRKAMALRPEDPAVYARVGFLLYERGQEDLALGYLRQARSLKSADPAVAWTISQIEVRQGRGDLTVVRKGGRAGAATDRGLGEGALAHRAARPSNKPAAAQPPEAQPPADQPPRAEEPPPPAPVARSPEPPPDSKPRRPSKALAEPLPLDEPEAEVAPAELSRCAVPLRPGGSGSLLMDLIINGAEATFIIDTGATLTVVSDRFADRLDLPTDPDRFVRASTANGVVEMDLALMDHVMIHPMQVESAEVAVCQDCLHHEGDGLFGLDLQRRFQMELDPVRRIAWLGGCED